MERRGSIGTGADLDTATRAHFTARAPHYSGSGDASLEAMLELAALQQGERALDVATGTGLVLLALAEQVGPDGMAVGADFTPAMLAQAARRRA
ncbi:MAG: methyltransferase domain-containing protein, partial [Chloroflexota bacterium]